MRDKDYAPKLAEDLNKLANIPVGRMVEIPDNKSFKRTMALNNRVLKLEANNKALLSACKKALLVFNYMSTEKFSRGKDKPVRQLLEKVIKQVEED